MYQIFVFVPDIIWNKIYQILFKKKLPDIIWKKTIRYYRKKTNRYGLKKTDTYHQWLELHAVLNCSFAVNCIQKKSSLTAP